MVRLGGRPRQITEDDIVRAGRELGMRGLSLNAVAERLGVTAAALYRHVEGRWGLERLVGESFIADLQLRDDPGHDLVQHLLSLGLQLRTHVLAHPGLGVYLQTLFPRGEAGRRLHADAAAALERRGYSREAAIIVCGAVASIAIGAATAEELQRERAEGLQDARRSVLEEIQADERLAAAHARLPEMDPETYLRLLLTAAISGLVAVGPPGRPVADVLGQLESMGKGV